MSPTAVPEPDPDDPDDFRIPSDKDGGSCPSRGEQLAARIVRAVQDYKTALLRGDRTEADAVWSNSSGCDLLDSIFATHLVYPMRRHQGLDQETRRLLSSRRDAEVTMGRRALVYEFLSARLFGLPESALQKIGHPLLSLYARQFLWGQHAELDRPGARCYAALSRAFRGLHAKGPQWFRIDAPKRQPGQDRPGYADWLYFGAVWGSPNPASFAPVPELEQELRSRPGSAGWNRLSADELEQELVGALRALQVRLSAGGAYCGATARDILQALCDEIRLQLRAGGAEEPVEDVFAGIGSCAAVRRESGHVVLAAHLYERASQFGGKGWRELWRQFGRELRHVLRKGKKRPVRIRRQWLVTTTMRSIRKSESWLGLVKRGGPARTRAMALETLEQLFSVVVGLVPKPKKIAQELLRHVERGSNIRKVPKHTVLYEDRAVLCVAIKNLIKRSMR